MREKSLLGTVLSQINPFPIIISYFSIILTLKLGLPNGFLYLGFIEIIMYEFIISPLRAYQPRLSYPRCQTGSNYMKIEIRTE